MSGYKVVLDGSSDVWMDVFKNNPDIRAGLNKVIAPAAAKNTAALQQSAVPGLKPEHKFVAVVDVGDKSMLGKVAATNGAKGVAKKAGLPNW